MRAGRADLQGLFLRNRVVERSAAKLSALGREPHADGCSRVRVYCRRLPARGDKPGSTSTGSLGWGMCLGEAEQLG